MCASASATSRSIAAGSSDAPTDFTTRYVPRVFEITCTDTVPLLFFFLRTNMGAFYPSGHPLLNLGYVVKPRNSDLRGRDENRKNTRSQDCNQGRSYAPATFLHSLEAQKKHKTAPRRVCTSKRQSLRQNSSVYLNKVSQN